MDITYFIQDLTTVREQLYVLNKQFNLDLGNIQVGYETAINDLLELAGYTEDQINLIWNISEPDRTVERLA